MRKFSTHGIEHNLDALENKDMPAYYYEMQDLGFNYRLSDLQAALGISQLAKVDELLRKRREIAHDYQELLGDSENLTLPVADTPESISSWHLYQVGIKGDFRDTVYKTLRSRGIGVQIHYLPIYDHPYYKKLKDYPLLDGAEYFFKHTLSIPLYPNLKKLDMQMVAATLQSVVDNLNE